MCAVDSRPVLAVYLAGGMHSGWQDKVIASAPELRYWDPRSSGLKDEVAYTAWDLRAIRNSDIVFAYLERSNPSGAGLALEVGYAAALGKIIIVVCDPDHRYYRYFGMVRQCAHYGVSTLEAGIAALRARVSYGLG